jgi:hypothetical protein
MLLSLVPAGGASRVGLGCAKSWIVSLSDANRRKSLADGSTKSFEPCLGDANVPSATGGLSIAQISRPEPETEPLRACTVVLRITYLQRFPKSSLKAPLHNNDHVEHRKRPASTIMRELVF